MNTHEMLITQAKKAIEVLFSDVSVPPEQTVIDLQELRDEIDMKLESLGS